MENVLIDIRELNEDITKYFKNKDYVTLKEMFDSIDELLYEIRYLEEKIEEIEQDRDSNYKPIGPYEMYGISEHDFY